MSNSIVNLGDPTKPLDTLINKISDATGVLFEPTRIRRKAKAESDAAIISAKAEAAVDKIKAESAMEITDLHKRAAQRRIEEDARQQKNMEDIITKAAPHLKEEAKPDAMDDDWISNFFDKSRIVSDSEMQSLWSRVLAGEANAPGTYSKRTVNFVAALEKSEAHLFTKLCGFVWKIHDFVPLVFDLQAAVYNRHGIDFGPLSHLESIGLVKLAAPNDFRQTHLPRRFPVYYYGKSLFLEIPPNSENEIMTGKARFTKIGQELAPICGSKPVEGFYEYVKSQWRQYLPKDENKE